MGVFGCSPEEHFLQQPTLITPNIDEAYIIHSASASSSPTEANVYVAVIIVWCIKYILHVWPVDCTELCGLSITAQCTRV